MIRLLFVAILGMFITSQASATRGGSICDESDPRCTHITDPGDIVEIAPILGIGGGGGTGGSVPTTRWGCHECQSTEQFYTCSVHANVFVGTDPSLVRMALEANDCCASQGGNILYTHTNGRCQ